MQTAPTPPSAEEIANAVWAKDHPAPATSEARPGFRTPPQHQAASKPRKKRRPKTAGKSKRRRKRHRSQPKFPAVALETSGVGRRSVWDGCTVGYLSLTDLFLVGLALDISGATLLAKGLLLSPRALARLNTNWGVGYGQHEDRCRNRVLGEFGVIYLVAGFALQAVGYSLEIGGVLSKTGTGRLVAALAMAAAGAGIAWALWGLLKERRFNALLAAVESQSDAAGKEIEAAEAARKTRES